MEPVPECQSPLFLSVDAADPDHVRLHFSAPAGGADDAGFRVDPAPGPGRAQRASDPRRSGRLLFRARPRRRRQPAAAARHVRDARANQAAPPRAEAGCGTTLDGNSPNLPTTRSGWARSPNGYRAPARTMAGNRTPVRPPTSTRRTCAGGCRLRRGPRILAGHRFRDRTARSTSTAFRPRAGEVDRPSRAAAHRTRRSTGDRADHPAHRAAGRAARSAVRHGYDAAGGDNFAHLQQLFDELHVAAQLARVRLRDARIDDVRARRPVHGVLRGRPLDHRRILHRAGRARDHRPVRGAAVRTAPPNCSPSAATSISAPSERDGSDATPTRSVRPSRLALSLQGAGHAAVVPARRSARARRTPSRSKLCDGCSIRPGCGVSVRRAAGGCRFLRGRARVPGQAEPELAGRRQFP